MLHVTVTVIFYIAWVERSKINTKEYGVDTKSALI